jgi:voltage-gated potassium channel Kch
LLLYFSVVTMTTLGYGDISPAMPAARMLCSFEAVIGQLFVAIFIARLVSLHIGRKSQ